jgi:lipocalin
MGVAAYDAACQRYDLACRAVRQNDFFPLLFDRYVVTQHSTEFRWILNGSCFHKICFLN